MGFVSLEGLSVEYRRAGPRTALHEVKAEFRDALNCSGDRRKKQKRQPKLPFPVLP